jgi:PAP2 superfamily
MRIDLLSYSILALSCILCVPALAQVHHPHDDLKPAQKPNLAYEWMDVALEATARDTEHHGARPPIGARQLAIVATAMFDAWAAYDDKAVGTRLGDLLRRPAAERTLENKKEAISYAIYRALLDQHPDSTAYITEQMRGFGYDPSNDSTDRTTPQGIGNETAAAIIAYRHHDGANQLGDEVGSNGQPYSDYTHYMSVNTEDKVVDPNRWHPIPFDDGKGGKVLIPFLAPHWYRVKPFALERSDQFRSPPPPAVGSEQMEKEVKENMELNANLTDERKAIVEFMRDGPRSTGQAGHWLRFAQLVGLRDRHDLDSDVKMYFAVLNTAMDAFIASWDTKRFYDNSRPYFPGYVSGHSTVSGACAETLRFFTGSDYFGQKVTVEAGGLTGEPGPHPPVVLDLPTFTATAEMAGISRVYGGYHLQIDNVEGLKLGRKVAKVVWNKALTYFDGTAPPAER